MKRTPLLTLGLMGCMAATAQVPGWTIAPSLDSLKVVVDNTVIRADSAGTTTFYSMDGKTLYRTTDHVGDYHDSVATVTRGDVFVGLLDAKGDFTTLPPLKVAYNKPDYDDGLLTAAAEDGVGYYNKKGEKAVMDFWAMRSYPYSHGYAPYFIYSDLETLKNPHYGYYDRDGKAASFTIEKKGEKQPLHTKDIRFLSAIGDNGQAVAVIKGKIYMLDASTMEFTPVLYGPEDLPVKKRQLSLAGSDDLFAMELPDTVEFNAKYGKDGKAVLRFTGDLKPVSIDFGDNVVTFTAQADSAVSAPAFDYASQYITFTEGGKFGLATTDSTKVLPAQFDAVGLLYGNRAFVKTAGKWGVIAVNPGENYKVKINGGKSVDFRHSQCPTTLEIDFPAGVSAKAYSLVASDSIKGLALDAKTMEATDSSLVYNCVLDMPSGLADSVATYSLSPLCMTCDGIALYGSPISYQADYVDHFKVELQDSAVMKGADAMFTLAVNPDLLEGENSQPYSVHIISDVVPVMYGKMADNLYKFMIASLPEGVTSFKVMVREDGCPDSAYPINVTYVKADSVNNISESLTVAPAIPEPKVAAAPAEPQIEFMQSITSTGEQTAASATKPEGPVMQQSITSKETSTPASATASANAADQIAQAK